MTAPARAVLSERGVVTEWRVHACGESRGGAGLPVHITRNLKMDGCRLDPLCYSDGFERRRCVPERIDLGLP